MALKQGIRARWSGELGGLGGGPVSRGSLSTVSKSCHADPWSGAPSLGGPLAGAVVGSGFFVGLSSMNEGWQKGSSPAHSSGEQMCFR